MRHRRHQQHDGKQRVPASASMQAQAGAKQASKGKGYSSLQWKAGLSVSEEERSARKNGQTHTVPSLTLSRCLLFPVGKNEKLRGDPHDPTKNGGRVASVQQSSKKKRIRFLLCTRIIAVRCRLLWQFCLQLLAAELKPAAGVASLKSDFRI